MNDSPLVTTNFVVKEKFLGIEPSVAEREGVVSEAVAGGMAWASSMCSQ